MSIAYLASLIGTLAIVAAMAVGYVFLLRYLNNAKGKAGGQALELAGRISFGVSSSVVLVRYGKQDYLIAVAKDGITLLDCTGSAT